MKLLDSTLDASLIGYTRFGFMARGLSVHETFPSVAGKHVLVTGATRGIGRSMVERLAANGAIVHAVGRNPSALGDLVRLGEERVVAHTADLSSMESVADLATEFIASGQDLHGLINNVSVMSQERRVTAEGLELTYATNLLGQYVLTRRLLPALEAGSTSSVVMVSSGGMYSQGLTATNIDSSEGEYTPTGAYARTKRGEVVLARVWAEEFAAAGVKVNSMHPGWVDTDGVRDSLPGFYRATRPILRSPAQGADTAVWLVAGANAESPTGGFLHDRLARPLHRTGKTATDDSTLAAFLERLDHDAAPYLIDSQEPKE